MGRPRTAVNVPGLKLWPLKRHVLWATACAGSFCAGTAESSNQWVETESIAGPALAAAPDDVYSLMDLMPGGLDLIAILNAPGGLGLDVGPMPEHADSGRSFEQTLLEWMRNLGLLEQSARSWSMLSKRLGMSEQQAAQALLGGTVVIGMTGLERGGLLDAIDATNQGWILIGEIDDAVSKKLRERLNAVPRRISSSYPVYTIDTGQTGLSLARDGDVWRFVMAPARNSGLVDDVLRAFRSRVNRTEPLGVDDPFVTDHNARDARSLGVPVDPDWSAVVSVRFAAGQKSPLVFTTHGGGDVLHARFGMQGRYRHGAPVDVLRDVGGDALLAVATAGEPWNGSDAIILALQREGKNFDSPIRFPQGFTMTLRDSGRPNSGQLTTVISGWATTEDPFAETVDEAISQMIASDTPPAHRGRFPNAVRTQVIDGRLERSSPLPESGQSGQTQQPLSGFKDQQSRVAWCLHSESGNRVGVVSICLGDEDSDVARHAMHAREAWARYTGSDTRSGRDVVMMGIAQPARLLQAFGMQADPFVGLLGHLEYAEWRLVQSDDVLRGDITVRLSTTRARLGAE